MLITFPNISGLGPHTYSSGQNRGKSQVLPQLQEPTHNSRFYFASPVYSSQSPNVQVNVRPGYLLDRYV